MAGGSEGASRSEVWRGNAPGRGTGQYKSPGMKHASHFREHSRARNRGVRKATPQRHRGPTLLVPTRVFHPYGETTSRCHRLLELQPARPSSRCTEKEDEEVEAGAGGRGMEAAPLPAELCRSRGRPGRAAPHRWREPGDKTIPHRREVWGCPLLAAFMVSPVQARVQLLKKEGSRDTGGGGRQ